MNIQLLQKLTIVLALLFLGLQPNAKAQTCSVNAGVDSRICVSGSTMTLSGNSTGAFGTSASWALVSGPNVPTITSPTSATTTVTGFVAGTYRFRYHAICSDASVVSDSVNVIVDAVPVFTAGTDTFICGPSRVMNATLPAGATGVWSAVNLPSTASGFTPSFSSNAPNATISIPITINCPKEYYAIYSVTQGACTARDTAKVSTAGQSLSSISYPDATYCGTTYTASSIYMVGCGFSFTYVQLAGPSIATMTNNYGTAAGFQPFVSNLTTGTYTFALAITPCDGVVRRDTFNLTIGSTVAVTNPYYGSIILCADQFDTVYYSQPTIPLLPGETITFNLAGVTGVTPGHSLSTPTVDTIGNILRWRNVLHPDTNATGLWYYVVPYTVSNGTCSLTNFAYIYLYAAMGNKTYQSVVNLPCGATSGNIAVPNFGTNAGYGFFNGVSIAQPTGAPTPTFNDGGGSYNASGLQPGRYVFSFQFYRVNASSCEVRSSVVEVNVSAPAGAANAGTNQVLPCGIDSSTLAGNVPVAGQIGTWQLVAGPSSVVLTNPHSASLVVKNLLPGVYTFRWSIANGSTCPATADDMQVIVTPTLSASNAGADRSVCYGYTTVLNGNPPTLGGTGRWRQIGGPVVAIADTTAASTSFTGSIASTVYTFTWTLSNICGSDTDTVVITTTASQGPSNAVISTADACITTAGFSSTSLSAVTPSSGTGAWSQLSGPATATISTPTSATTSVSGLGTLGEYKFVWTVTATGCDTLRDTVSIANRGTSAITASAGVDKYICADTVRMTATAPSSGRIGTWTQIGGPGSSIDSINKPTALVSGLVNGSTYDYVWTVSLGVCPVVRDTVHLGVSSLPSAAIARTDTLICNNVLGVSSALTLPLTATTPTAGVGAWSILESPFGGATISNPGLATTTGNFKGGITKLAWTIVNGSCPASRDTVVIEIAPKADAGPATASLCETISYPLQGTQPGSGTVLWIQTAGPTTATITQPTSPFTNINNMASGVYKFLYTLTHPVSGCSSVDSITITNSTRPVSNARRDSIFCYRPTGGTPLYLIADTPSLGTGAWSRISGTGTVTFAPSTTANPSTATVSSVGSGLQQFRWTVTNGACQAFDVKDVLIERLPSPGIVFTPTTACRDSFTVTGTAPSLAFNYAWSFPKARIKDTAGIGLTGPIANNFLISDTNSIYLMITNPATGCTANDSTAIIVDCAYLPLPLNFLSIQSKVKECSVQLQWDFNVEGNSKLDHFVIERSNNGRNFDNIATFKQDVKSYVDNPSGGTVWYYRIKAVGIDNEQAYSPTQVANTINCVANELSVYPNPTSQILNVVLKANTSTNSYQLIDALGKVIMQGNLYSNSINKIDVNTLPRGVYMLKVQTEGGVKMQQVQIVK